MLHTAATATDDGRRSFAALLNQHHVSNNIKMHKTISHGNCWKTKEFSSV